jgi:hypothetical protein
MPKEQTTTVTRVTAIAIAARDEIKRMTFTPDDTNDYACLRERNSSMKKVIGLRNCCRQSRIAIADTYLVSEINELREFREY